MSWTFFKREELKGENKYEFENDVGEKIKCDADKYYIFKKIPNFLFLQLKRFKYNHETSTIDKNNKYISFHEELDLSKYLQNNNNSKSKRNNEGKNIYILYCVIVRFCWS